MITFKTYNKKQLEEFISSKKYLEYSFKPISSHRANSHLNNPRAMDFDTLLIMAFEEDKFAGYIGVLPDDIFHKGQPNHFGWLSTFFVHPDFRGKRIAQQLLFRACDEYDGRIMSTEYAPKTENMYLKSKFFEYQNPLKGKTFHYLFNLSKILPTKNRKLEKFVPFFKFIDFSANTFLKTTYKIFNSKTQNFVIANNLDNETIEFIEKQKKENSFNRKSKEIDWIVRNPWILKGEKDKNYFFSDFEKDFKYIFIKIYQDKSMKNLMMLSVRNSVAKLLFTLGESNSETCANYLYSFAIANNISSIISFDGSINQNLEKRFFIFKKERLRKFFMHKELIKILGENFKFDAGAEDGDAVFT